MQGVRSEETDVETRKHTEQGHILSSTQFPPVPILAAPPSNESAATSLSPRNRPRATQRGTGARHRSWGDQVGCGCVSCTCAPDRSPNLPRTSVHCTLRPEAPTAELNSGNFFAVHDGTIFPASGHRIKPSCIPRSHNSRPPAPTKFIRMREPFQRMCSGIDRSSKPLPSSRCSVALMSPSSLKICGGLAWAGGKHPNESIGFAGPSAEMVGISRSQT